MSFHRRLGQDSLLGKLEKEVVIMILKLVDFTEYTESRDVRKLWQLLEMHGGESGQPTSDSGYLPFGTQLLRSSAYKPLTDIFFDALDNESEHDDNTDKS